MGGGGSTMGGILSGIDSKPVVKAAPPKKMAVSSGVMQGNLLTKTQPIYPAIAKAARISGTVVLQATISKIRLYRESARCQRSSNVAAGCDGCGSNLEIQALPAQW